MSRCTALSFTERLSVLNRRLSIFTISTLRFQVHPQPSRMCLTLFYAAALQVSEENFPPLHASLEMRWYLPVPILSLQGPIPGPLPPLETPFGHLKVPVQSSCNTMAFLPGWDTFQTFQKFVMVLAAKTTKPRSQEHVQIIP